MIIINNNKRTTVIGIRVPLWLNRLLERESEKLYDGNKSEAAKKRLKKGYKDAVENDELDLTETETSLINAYDRHIDAHAELEFIERENQISQAKMKELTFAEYLDSKLAKIYITNIREGKTVDTAEEDMIEWLETRRKRAEFHDKVEEFEKRIEDPSEFAQQYLDERMKREKIKGDGQDIF